MTGKVPLNDLASLANETSAIATLNANFAAIEEGFNKTIFRDGTSPNTLEDDLNMNTSRLYGIPLTPTSNDEAASKYYVDNNPGPTGPTGATGPQGETGPQGDQGDAVIWIVDSGAPSDIDDGEDGDMYLDSDTGEVYGPKASGAWGSAAADLTGPTGPTGPAGGGLTDVVNDLTPQLGGDLDANSNSITGLSTLTVTGTDGFDVNPGSDTDADLITVGVTGTPTVSWDESSDGFRSSKPWIISSDGEGDLTHTIAGASVTSDLEVHSEGSTDLGGIAIHRHTDTNNFGGHLLFLRSDGTHAFPSAVDDNDVLGRIIGLGQDGTDYETAAEIRFLIDGTPANNNMPGEIKFYTNAGSQTLTERMNIQADGSVNVTGSTLTVNSQAVLDASDIGSSVQAYDADLDTWAGLTPSSNAQSLVTAANYAAMRGLLDLEAGTDFYSITAADTAIEVSSVNAQTGTTYTLVIGDRGQTVTMNNASANTLTIPTNASVAFDTGTVVHVIMLGAGTTSIEGDTGVTLNGVSAGSGDINNQYQGVSLLKIGTNTWVASGDIGTVA